MIDSLEASKRLGMNRTAITEMARVGILPATKFGKALVFDEKQLKQFAKKHGMEIKP